MLNEATLIMRSGTAVRSYTQNEISPLIVDQLAVRFLPHTVPSYSAQTVLHQLQKDFPDYSYKEAALNPTNPSDRATNWESDVINAFKREPILAVVGQPRLDGEHDIYRAGCGEPVDGVRLESRQFRGHFHYAAFGVQLSNWRS